ncbi:polysaccharide pyruvyl transferase family protein [Sphingomicrobium sp. XHP0239]|uniref:polysaccharide pyruvyl transferase family protein n=1 Tax=Sphingomicrobium maritimum TaxID=3133972 RepID=UPI0031CC7AD4
MTDRSRPVVLVTKTATQNQGNQALSIAWRDFLVDCYPERSVRLVERGPAYLKRYRLSSIAKDRDPVAAFDRIAEKLVAAVPERPDRDPSTGTVRHDASQKQAVRFLKLRRMLNLRGRLMQLGVGRGAYLDRLSYLCNAGLLVVNPAGEFYNRATDTALHYLLETRCAQLAGVPVAFVNLSYEIEDPALLRIARHVLDQCDLVEFRDEESRRHFAANGGAADPVILPDGATMAPVERAEQRGGRGLALAINALQVNHYDLVEPWNALVARLVEREPVTLTSNEWTTDHPFWSRYLSMDGVSAEGRTLPFDEYARLLSQFDVVVSSRLHTCVLGLVAGVPIVPVETGTFKLTGFFNMIGMGDEPIRMEGEDWQDRILERIDAVTANREARLQAQDDAIAKARAEFARVLGRRFGEIELR